MSENNRMPERTPRSPQEQIRRADLADAAAGVDSFVPLQWLKGTGASIVDALMAWDKGELAVVPAGHGWDVVRMPRPLGWRTVQHLRESGSIVGPVLHNETHVEVLVPTGSVADWDLPGATVVTAGNTILVPHPSIVAPRTQNSRTWIVPPSGTILTDGNELYGSYAAALATMDMDTAR